MDHVIQNDVNFEQCLRQQICEYNIHIHKQDHMVHTVWIIEIWGMQFNLARSWYDNLILGSTKG